MQLGAQLIKGGGCSFQVWAPHAQFVAVVGEFNGWNRKANPMTPGPNGVWSAQVSNAKAEQTYKFYIEGPAWNPQFKRERPDPWARQMEHSAGASIIKDKDAFRWEDANWQRQYQTFEDMVIYELHVTSFIGRNDGQGFPGNFNKLTTKLDYLRNLGVHAIELLPIHEFFGDNYLGYAPVAFFPVETSLGSRRVNAYDEFKALVNLAHTKGLAVIADVVFNHFTDQSNEEYDQWIRNYDGDTKFGRGGIYLSGINTPWGPAPDWEDGMVEAYVEAACRYYLEELHVDGLRWDFTNYISDKPNGWSAMQRIVWNLKQEPWGQGKIFIAEHHDYSSEVVGSGNFDSGWYVDFHHIIERELGGESRKGGSVYDAINGGNYSQPHKRLVYAMSHDEARNGSQYHASQFGGRNLWESRAKCRFIGSLGNSQI